MDKQIANPLEAQKQEYKITEPSRNKDGEWRLKKALDILVNYLIALEKEERKKENKEKDLLR